MNYSTTVLSAIFALLTPIAIRYGIDEGTMNQGLQIATALVGFVGVVIGRMRATQKTNWLGVQEPVPQQEETKQ